MQSRFSYPFMRLESFLFLVLAFRAIIPFGIQCHHHFFFLVLAFRAIIYFGVQSHRTYPFRHLEPPSFHVLKFKVVSPQLYHSESQSLTFILIGITHLALMGLHLSLFSSPRYLAVITCSSCSSRLPPPLHMT